MTLSERVRELRLRFKDAWFRDDAAGMELALLLMETWADTLEGKVAVTPNVYYIEGLVITETPVIRGVGNTVEESRAKFDEIMKGEE